MLEQKSAGAAGWAQEETAGGEAGRTAGRVPQTDQRYSGTVITRVNTHSQISGSPTSRLSIDTQWNGLATLLMFKFCVSETDQWCSGDMLPTDIHFSGFPNIKYLGISVGLPPLYPQRCTFEWLQCSYAMFFFFFVVLLFYTVLYKNTVFLLSHSLSGFFWLVITQS